MNIYSNLTESESLMTTIRRKGESDKIMLLFICLLLCLLNISVFIYKVFT